MVRCMARHHYIRMMQLRHITIHSFVTEIFHLPVATVERTTAACPKYGGICIWYTSGRHAR